MRTTAKLRIINLVKKIINYKDPITPPFKEEKRKIQELKCSFHLHQIDSEHELKYILSHEIATKLEAMNVIDYRKDINPFGGYIINARVLFVDPFNK